MSFMDAIKNIKAHTPVIVKGKAIKRHVAPKSSTQQHTSEAQTNKSEDKKAQSPEERSKSPQNTVPAFDPFVGDVSLISHLEIQEVVSIRQLNQFPRDLIATTETVFPRNSATYNSGLIRDFVNVYNSAQKLPIFAANTLEMLVSKKLKLLFFSSLLQKARESSSFPRDKPDWHMHCLKVHNSTNRF